MASAADIPALVQRVRHSRGIQQLQAAKALGNAVRQHRELYGAAAAHGGTDALADCLASSSTVLQTVAAVALVSWAARSPDGGRAVANACVATGAVPAIVRLLQRSHADGNESALMGATGLLMHLTAAECGQAVLEAGGIPALVQLVQPPGGAQQPATVAGLSLEAAVKALHNMANVDTGPGRGPAFGDAIAAAGGIERFVRLFGSSSSSLHPQLREVSALALAKLVRLNPTHYDALVACGGAAIPERICACLNASGGGEAQQRLVQGLMAPRLRSLSNQALGRAVASAAAAAAAGQQPQPQPQPQAPQGSLRICANPGCGATERLRRCGGCGAVRYCGEACSRAHWRTHKPECRRLQAASGSGAAG